MKISIITVTYNSEKTVEDTFNSVLEQTYSDIEYIVVDGKSTDNTVDIIKKYEPLFKGRMHWICKPDKGIYDALNKGIRLATGDIIGFTHSDDMLASPDIIQKISYAFSSPSNIGKENINISGVYGNLLFFSGKKPNKIIRTWTSKPFNHKNIKYGWVPPHPTLFLKKEVYKKCGLFDISFRISGDYDFMLRIMKDKKINLVSLPEIITKMRIGGKSTGNLKQIIVKSMEDIRALHKNGFRFPLFTLSAKNIRKLPQLLKR